MLHIIFLHILRLLAPPRIRLLLYKILAQIGNYLYGGAHTRRIQRLPFNLYLKSSYQSQHAWQTEVHALQLLMKLHTSVDFPPAPRVLDVICIRGEEEDDDHQDAYILMTRLPGKAVSSYILENMTPGQLRRFRHDLTNLIQQIRHIQNPYPYKICSAAGGPLTDFRLITKPPAIDMDMDIDMDMANPEVAGPFHSEEEFNQFLVRSAAADPLQRRLVPDPAGRGNFADEIRRVHSKMRGICFTHADLAPRNLLVMEDGRLSGIVDWETAGFYPNYWEYTKSRYTVRSRGPWLDMVKEIWSGVYEEEYEVESRLWPL